MAVSARAAIRRWHPSLLWRMGRRQLRGFHIFSAAVNEGRSADTFWPKVTERLQAAPGGAVATRLADAVRSGLEGEGQAEGPAQAVFDAVRAFYAGLQQGEEKLSFFTALASPPDTDQSGGGPPLFAAVLSQLGRQKGGLQFLVDLRRDLLALSRPSSLCALEEALTELLGQYCSRDLLQVEKVTWQSPSDLIEKISMAEVVHPIRHWKDIKSRLGHNMRCFVLTHRGIPREPLVVLHSALTSEPSASVQDLLQAASRDDCSGRGFSTAVFYSVWLRERGLSGLDLPNLLIKMAAADLQAEFPYMDVFYTLSPVPGFRRWLEGQLRQTERAADVSGVRGVQQVLDLFPTERGEEGTADSLKMVLDTFSARCDDARFTEALRSPLTHLCVRYLTTRRGGRVIDPVANFHLCNGASLYRVNWLADRSVRGLRRSYGIMANYCYNMADLASNTRRYVHDGEVPCSSHQLEQWLI